MATSLKTQHQNASKRLNQAQDAIYACAPNNETPWNRCWQIAGETPAGAYKQDRYLAARDELVRIEAEAIAACKAYRGSFEMLRWYR